MCGSVGVHGPGGWIVVSRDMVSVGVTICPQHLRSLGARYPRVLGLGPN